MADDTGARLPPDEEGTPPEKPFEEFPLTREEYISAMTHFYRGELGRADAWRSRLDPTTNWAVVTAGGMLSIAFTTPEHSHVTLLLAVVLITVFLGFEARRFRYYDVWRSRVRMMEENFFIPILRRNLVSPREDWRDYVAEDLDRPTFKMTLLEAVGMRLWNNYLWIYFAVLLAWIVKLHLHPDRATSPGQLVERAEVGPLGGEVMLGLVILFYLAAVWLALGERGRTEIRGIERAPKREQWKR
ncbi:MAG: DUF2270 domain-containing protein [Gemmatimonadota bacterium]|nr:DUF2270 domain-containing protein [Gemmatimonadota bacterium]